LVFFVVFSGRGATAEGAMFRGGFFHGEQQRVQPRVRRRRDLRRETIIITSALLRTSGEKNPWPCKTHVNRSGGSTFKTTTAKKEEETRGSR
jgi:hypothetical protein